MIFSLLIVVFLLFMVYWWGSQGLFSAFIHLLATIAAGAIAIAVWEPLALGLFMNRLAGYAWGVSLVGSFVLLLIGIRFALDRAVRANLHFSSLVNYIGGGAFGLFAGILSAGILVMGLSFLPLPKDMLGYDPMNVSPQGQVQGEPDTSLFPAVNKYTAGFYNMLSMGAFSTRTPLAVYQPQLAEQAARFRLRYDPYSSLTAAKDDITINGLYMMPTPLQGIDDVIAEKLGPDARRTGNQLAIVDTLWIASARGTYDKDGMLRVPPTQVRLVSVPANNAGGDAMLHAPVGYSAPVGGGPRVFTDFSDDRTYAYGTTQQTELNFAFIVPLDRKPAFILIRHTRFELPAESQRDPALVAAAVGGTEAKPLDLAGVRSGTEQTGGDEVQTIVDKGRTANVKTGAIDITSALPAQISANYATGLEWEGPEGQRKLKAGSAEVARPDAGINPKTAVSHVYHPSQQVMVRLTLSRTSAQTALGASLAAATMLQPIYLTDVSGQKHFPIGYVWMRADGTQEINFVSNRNQPFTSARQLPIHRMQGDENLYLYFQVAKEARAITKVNVGEGTWDEIIPPKPL